MKHPAGRGCLAGVRGVPAGESNPGGTVQANVFSTAATIAAFLS